MEFKTEIDNLREGFAIHRQHNDRIMVIIDALYTENQELKRMMTMKFKDIDDEQ